MSLLLSMKSARYRNESGESNFTGHFEKNKMMYTLVVVFSIIYLSVPTCYGGEREVVLFQEKYQEAFNRIEKLYSSLSGTIQITRENNNDLQRKDRATFQNSGDASIASLKTDEKISREMVFCLRPQGSYALTRKVDGISYGVQSLGIMAEALYIRNIGQYLRSPYSFMGEPFDRLIQNKTFHINSTEEDIVKGVRQFRLKYTYGDDSTAKISTRVPNHQATFTFLPDHAWVMSDGEIMLSNSNMTNSYRFKAEYSKTINEIPILSKLTYTENDRMTTCLFETSVQNVTDNQFAMSRFGLPEMEPEKKRKNHYQGYLYFALSCVFIIIGLRINRRFFNNKLAG